MVQVFSRVLVCGDEVFCLLLNDFGNFVDVLSLSMRALPGSFSEALLAETDDFGLRIELVGLHLSVMPGLLCAELLTTILGEKILSSNFFNGFTVLSQIMNFLIFKLVFVGVLLKL